MTTPSVVQPGVVTLTVDWLDAIHTFEEGDIAILTVEIVDAETMQSALDPESLTIYSEVGTTDQPEITWLYANWDGVTVPEKVSVGTLARTGQGVYQTWLDTTSFPGEWTVEAATTGAGQGRSAQEHWVVSPKMA